MFKAVFVKDAADVLQIPHYSTRVASSPAGISTYLPGDAFESVVETDLKIFKFDCPVMCFD